MAVFQISKIQIRRGKSNSGSGLPQLASGELAWSIDTAELFIGNGSVAEGAPQVGNTKILTENDLLKQGNLLTLTNHSYQAASFTTQHSIQTVLDYSVNSDAFNTIRNGIVDDTVALQTAIMKLFRGVSNPAYLTTPESIKARIVLNLLPGTYKITSTIYVPSYVTIVGAGMDKTIINYTGSGSLFEFINDTSTPTDIQTTSSSTRPKKIIMRDIGVNITDPTACAFLLPAVRDSLFENISIYGNWGNTFNSANIAFKLTAFSSVVTSENNLFKNITIDGFSYAVYSKNDISNNIFENMLISNGHTGFVLGLGTNLSSTGEVYGPRQTTITTSKFLNIKKQAILIDKGSSNFISTIQLSNVGNDGVINLPLYPQIFIGSPSNKSINIMSDRHVALSNYNQYDFKLYKPEISGHGEYSSTSSETRTLGQLSGYSPVIQLPVSTDRYGVPVGAIAYTVNYIYNSSIGLFARKGVISIMADTDNGVIQLTDEYDYAGTGSSSEQLALDFRVSFIDDSGNPYTGAAGQIASNIHISYSNSLVNDAGLLTYSYTSFF